MELGVYTFADTARDARTGDAVAHDRRLRDLLEEITLADEVGLDVFGVGEHHRADFAVSAPAVVLGAAAAVTKRIRLTSAVTVLSSDDPVRVFEQFATIDGLSGGRAEIMAGRGSFVESYPLFGYDLDDYDELFAEKLDLLLALRAGERVTWPGGRFRAALDDQGVYPRPVQDPLPLWIAVGGNPASVVRAATLGLPLALAIIGGVPARFRALTDLYREAARRAGHDPAALPIGINSPGFVAEDSKTAADRFFAPYAQVMSQIGRERGWPPLTREQYEAGRRPGGYLLVGSPEEVAERILDEHAIFGHDRFLLQTSMGPLAHAHAMRSIELLGTEVAPIVRAELDRRTAAAA
ncbi:MAG TPA: LLM class flavin-dependent oxidoreductase [Solirubrobacteraceae bacterium]|nr:LLM class flavin-dependent oxidoreductase [Solirubrobacteraceae bacterium]